MNASSSCVTISVHKIPTSDPADCAGLIKLFDAGIIDPDNIVAILGKTEGNGCVNDFTRGFATTAYVSLLAKMTGKSATTIHSEVVFVMSGGTEGILSPHITVFCRSMKQHDRAAEGSSYWTTPRMSVAVGHTREFKPEEIGRIAMVKEVASMVKHLVQEASITSNNDVHFVQIKCPLLTSPRIADAESRGKKVVCHDTYESMAYSRGASALGIALALGEVEEKALGTDDGGDSIVCQDYSFFSKVASTSAGVELMNCEIIVMGNTVDKNIHSDLFMAHTVMKDAIDGDSVRSLLHQQGISDMSKIVNLLAKAGPDKRGNIRGNRHTMMTDSDINSTRHARAAVGGVLASIVGSPVIYVSGGCEHQGNHGGGPVAVIAKKQ